MDVVEYNESVRVERGYIKYYVNPNDIVYYKKGSRHVYLHFVGIRTSLEYLALQ